MTIPTMFLDAERYERIYYSDESYLQEVDALEGLLRKYFPGRPRDILDVGCGTGLHGQELLKRGYSVTGLDISPAMCERARERFLPLGGRVVENDISKWKPDQVFDAAVCLFITLTYILEARDLVDALKNIFSSLRRKGVLYFDVISALWAYRNYQPLQYEDIADGVMIWSRELDEENDVMNGTGLFYRNGTKEVEKQQWKLFTGPQLRMLLYSIGFRKVEVFSGGLELKPYKNVSPYVSVIATK